MKHSPGPYHVAVEEGRYSVWGPQSDMPLAVIPDGPTAQDDARLIAATAELLADAKKLVNEVSSFMDAPELRDLIGNTNFAVLQERWLQMRETIAKAEGGS